jgi:S-formylglutathione hydrolase FrmB
LTGVALMSGWLAWSLIVLGLLGGGYLLYRREGWWRWYVPSVAVVAGIAAWVIGHTVAQDLFAEPLKVSDIAWIGAAIAAIGLAIGFLFRTAWWRKLLAVLAAVCVVAAAGNQINKSYEQFVHVSDLFGVSGEQQIGGPPAVTSAPTTVGLPTGPLATVWTPTGPNIPPDGKGKVSQITLPGTLSGFQARDGWVYYPPAYFADNPEPLPVLLVFHGQPGEPSDWLLGDRVQNVMDAYAAQHDGIAPIVVAPDVTGSTLANPLCTNSSLGQLDTYLSKDVPAAIHAQLRVDQDQAHWAVAGFSYGGTCSIEMATNHPELFRTFVDISGEEEPTLGSRQLTVDTAFGGDAAKFTAINPLDIMAGKKFPDTAGWFVVGSEDADYKAALMKVYQGAQHAGMDVQFWEAPDGGHDWGTPIAAMTHVMDWLGQRMNITG